jgi:hypothetical protein
VVVGDLAFLVVTVVLGDRLMVPLTSINVITRVPMSDVEEAGLLTEEIVEQLVAESGLTEGERTTLMKLKDGVPIVLCDTPDDILSAIAEARRP